MAKNPKFKKPEARPNVATFVAFVDFVIDSPGMNQSAIAKILQWTQSKVHRVKNDAIATNRVIEVAGKFYQGPRFTNMFNKGE